jgi:glycosyltransferase involved in cell wall biosynthesis
MKRSCHIAFDHMRGWFGIASLESLSQGKPVVAGLDAWNVGCIREFTGAEELPWVIARDGEQLFRNLESLVRDTQLRERLGKKSRRFMQNCWTEQRCLQILLDMYEIL